METDLTAEPGGRAAVGSRASPCWASRSPPSRSPGVVYWALQQEPPFPDTPGEWAALAAAVALYALATLVRGERWHSLLRAEGAHRTGPTRTASTSSGTPRTTSCPRARATRCGSS